MAGNCKSHRGYVVYKSFYLFFALFTPPEKTTTEISTFQTPLEPTLFLRYHIT